MVTVAQSKSNRKQHVLDLRKFTWLKPEKLLVIDASDVGWDTTPRGFIIQSPTGQSRRFAYRRAMVDGEGETTGWEFTAVQADCPIRKVFVLND